MLLYETNYFSYFAYHICYPLGKGRNLGGISKTPKNFGLSASSLHLGVCRWREHKLIISYSTSQSILCRQDSREQKGWHCRLSSASRFCRESQDCRCLGAVSPIRAARHTSRRVQNSAIHRELGVCAAETRIYRLLVGRAATRQDE